MRISASDIKNLVGTKIYRRGVDYFRKGRVRLLDIEEDYFRAIVVGTKEYEVEVQNDEGEFDVSCNCPYWDDCKHIVAAMLEAKRFYDDNPSAFQQGKSMRWQRYFDQALVTGSTRASHRSAQWQAIYLLKIKKRIWTLHPRKAYIKKDGSLGRLANISRWDMSKGELIRTSTDEIVLTYLERARIVRGSYFYYEDHLSVPADFDYGAKIGRILGLLRDSHLFLVQNQRIGERVYFNPDKCPVELRVEEVEGGIELIPFVRLVGEWKRLDSTMYVLSSDPVWVFYHNQLFELTGLKNARYLVPFSMAPDQRVFIPKRDVPRFFNTILPNLEVSDSLRFPKNFIKATINSVSKTRLYLKQVANDLQIQLKFLYSGIEVTWQDHLNKTYAVEPKTQAYVRLDRDEEKESEAAELILSTGAQVLSNGFFQVRKSSALDWLIDGLGKLLKNGFEVFGEERLKFPKIRRGDPRVSVSVASGIDWFDLQVDIEIEGTSVALSELRKAIRQNERFIKLADGSVARLPDKWLDRFRYLLNAGQAKGNRLRLGKYYTTFIDDLFEESETKNYDKDFKSQLTRLQNFSRIRGAAVHINFQGKLRTYQKAGYDWLYFLKEMRFGGCLADDMGLGKTVQALALLLNEHKNGALSPSLIVTPISIIFNWIAEAKRFAPGLRVLNHTGIERDREPSNFNKYDVILTSYGICRQDIGFLREFQFHYVILDESQKIKNPESQTAKAVRLLRANHKIALTGTPVENSTIELWSQFAFLNPGLLGNLSYFKKEFAKPIERNQDQQVAEMLRKMTFPFILRRTKDNVAKELPPKIENTIYCEMTRSQRKFYNEWRDSYRAEILALIGNSGLQKSRMQVLAGLTMLRQIACHPKTVEPSRVDAGGKFEAFFEMLEEILAERHKVLVFSQFVKMLTLIRAKLDGMRIPYEYLDGRTRDRETPVRRFQENQDCRLFLISLRAGGTGLNLTAADYVIHYDPWWNPAVEVQATDRTHRIGQDKHVFVYKLITKNSVEEKILELQQRKKALVSKLITTDAGFFKQLTREDVVGLFS